MIAKINWKKNWIFGVLLLVLIFSYAARFTYLQTNVAPYPDCVIPLTTEANELEQTWQPEVKWISGVDFSYTSENTFTSDLQLKIFSDDYSQILVETVIEKHSFEEGKEGGVSFSFDRTKLIPGERYRFQISLLNADSDGTIWIVAGSNYGGCTIGGEDTKTGVALDITFAKFSKIFWLVAVLFPLFSYALFIMCITGRKFEETVALSMFVEGLILYAFGLLEQLVLGLNMVYLLAFISFVAFIYLYNKKAMSIKDLFSPGLVIFFIFFLIILVVNHGEWLAKRDDMRHWGIAVRDMYYYNSFAKHPNTTVILPAYLPFSALIEYLFIYMNGLFSEDILLIAYQVMMLSVIIIFSKPLQKGKKIKKIIPVLVAMLSIPLIFYNDISSFIMVDPLQMMILSYCILCYYEEKITKFNGIRIICALMSLTLIKDIGLVLSAMIIFIILGDLIVEQIRNKKINIRRIFFPFVSSVVVLGLYFGWQMYIFSPSSQSDISQQEINEKVEDEYVINSSVSASGLTIENILRILKGEGEYYQNKVTDNYITELFEGKTYKLGNMQFSFIDLLFIVSFVVITFTFWEIWKRDKYEMYSFAVISIMASGVLCLFLLIMYWFMFGPYEAMDLTSMDRYLGTYICALIMVVFYWCYSYSYEDSRKSTYMIFFLSLIFFISTPVNRILIKNNEIEWYATEEMVYGHDDIVDILKSVAKRGEKVHLICSGSSGYSSYIFRNRVAPIISEYRLCNIVETEELLEIQREKYYKEGEYYAGAIASKETLESVLKENDYLVLFRVDEEFLESYRDILNSDSSLENGSVYRIHSDSGRITLELIGRTGIMAWS